MSIRSILSSLWHSKATPSEINDEAFMRAVDVTVERLVRTGRTSPADFRQAAEELHEIYRTGRPNGDR